MNPLVQTIDTEVVATVIGNAVWKGYKKYCKWCWKSFYFNK
jgi:hypothetical protein